MYFLVTIGYESEQVDRQGNPRIQKVKYVVEAESLEEASIVASAYRAEDGRSSQSVSISKLGVELVIDRETMPQYYGKKKAYAN